MEYFEKAIIDIETLNKKTKFSTFPPSDRLSNWVERFWSVQWDLPTDYYFDQVIIPNPNINLVCHYETKSYRITKLTIDGAVKSLFSYRLEKSGAILGVKFHVGAPICFLKQNAVNFTNNSIDFHKIFNDASSNKLEMSKDIPDCIKSFENLLFSLNLNVDQKANKTKEIVELVRNDHTINLVSQLVDRTDIGLRTLQRYFDKYVGVNPKWVIKIYRLQELKTHVEKSKNIDWAIEANKLGYFDQAHMINDFKSLFGTTPKNYFDY